MMNPTSTADKIIRSVCELQETPNPDDPDTIVVSLADLKTIIENKLDEQDVVAWRYRMKEWSEDYWQYFTREPRRMEDNEIWQSLCVVSTFTKEN